MVPVWAGPAWTSQGTRVTDKTLPRGFSKRRVPLSPSQFAARRPRFNHQMDVFKNITKHADTMCINKSTASGLQVQETSLPSKHSETPGPEPITTAIGFAYLKSVTVSTVKKKHLTVKGKEAETVLSNKSYSTFLAAAVV